MGSSSMIMVGSLMSARAISSSLRCPPDRLPAYSWALVSSLNRSRRVIACSVISFSRDRQNTGRSAKPKSSPRWPRAPRRMFSRTVIRLSALVSWKVRTMPARATRAALWRSILCSSNVQCPELGRSKPVSRLKNVVLPAPLGPISAVMAWRGTSRWSTSTAVTPPKLRVTRSATRIGSVLAAPGSRAVVLKSGTAVLGAVGVVGAGSVGMDRQLLLVPEDPLWSEDDQQHQHDADDDPAERLDLRDAHDVRRHGGPHDGLDQHET